MTGLYAPQFEQFGIELAGEGPVFTGKVATEDAEGSAWVMPLGPSCLVMEHSVVPRHDMSLMERTPEPYACVTQVSSAAVDCMPEAGISPANVRPLRGPWPASAVCTFVQSSCEEQFSPLKAGQLYHSRCIAFLPEYFEKLEERWPGSFEGLFGAFARPWAEDAQMAIGGALRRLTAARTRGLAGELYATGVVEALVADLAASQAAGELAAERAGGSASRRLAEEAAAEVERALDEGRRPGVDELAARALREPLQALRHLPAGDRRGRGRLRAQAARRTGGGASGRRRRDRGGGGGAPWLPQRRRLQPGLPHFSRREPQRLAGSAVEACPSCGVYPGMYAIAVLIFCHKKCDRPLTCGFLGERSF